jgi:formate-dependent nitrite reductase membrane component NrfD
VSDKPSAAWYLAPIFLGVIGSAIMWYVVKDEDHPDSKKMVRKGWVIGIVLTVISLAWIPFVLIHLAFIDDGERHLMHNLVAILNR